MSSSVDPIQILKEYCVGKKEIKCKDKFLAFGSKKLPLATPTAWRPTTGNKMYMLGDLWHFLNYHLLSNGPKNEYYSEIEKLRAVFPEIQIVSSIHQKEILKFFSGEIENSNDIDRSMNTNIVAKDLRKRSKPYNDTFNDAALKGQETGKSTNSILESLKGEIEIEKQRKSLEDIRIWERVLETKNSKLRTSKSFLWCNKLLESKHKQTREEAKAKSGNQTILDEILSKQFDKEPRPVIIVPNSLIQGNLNLPNARKFLKDGQYQTTTERKGFEKSSETFSYTVNGQRVIFEVFDDLQLVRMHKLMDNVVAIFLSDNPYQFKDSKKNYGEDNIAKLLTKYRGYYMKYSDVKINPIINNWNVKVLSIKRNQRHQDVMIHRDFWEDMVKFLNSKRR